MLGSSVIDRSQVCPSHGVRGDVGRNRKSIMYPGRESRMGSGRNAGGDGACRRDGSAVRLRSQIMSDCETGSSPRFENPCFATEASFLRCDDCRVCDYVRTIYFERPEQASSNEPRAPVAAKEDRTPVTIADFAVQAMITSLLAEKYPSIPMMCTSRPLIA